MSHRERMSAIDLAWLRMDRPNNLMVIVGVLMFEGPVSLKRLETQLGERLSAHRRFRQRVEIGAGVAYWRDDAQFDLARHVHRVRLPGRGGKQALEQFVADLASEPLDPHRPLWQIHIVEKYEGGAAAIIRIHHAIGDGSALIGVMLSLADGAEKGLTARPPGLDEEEGWLQSVLAPVTAAIDAGAQASGFTWRQALQIMRQPSRATDYLKTGAGVATELAYLALMPSDSPTRFKGVPLGAKRVAWSESLRLPEVKAVAHALGCSINDILLSCVAGAMRDYLAEKGDATDGVEVRALVPIDLRSPAQRGELGNRFGILALELPVGDPTSLGAIIHGAPTHARPEILARAARHARADRRARLHAEDGAGSGVQPAAQSRHRRDDQCSGSHRDAEDRRLRSQSKCCSGCRNPEISASASRSCHTPERCSSA